MFDYKITPTRKAKPKDNFNSGNLKGLKIYVDFPPGKFYRFDGPVESIPLHSLDLFEEFGFEVEQVKKFIEAYKKTTGQCRNFELFDECVKNLAFHFMCQKILQLIFLTGVTKICMPYNF